MTRMKDFTKIVLVGAGSAVFTKGLVADLIQSRELGPWELGLVDTDPEALETAEGLSRRMVEAMDADIRVQASVDRRELLPDADIVVTTIGVGKRRAWEADVFIPRKYGIYQPVGDTVMPGGISRAMRMIPALVAIARDIAQTLSGGLVLQLQQPDDGELLGGAAGDRRPGDGTVPRDVRRESPVGAFCRRST